LEAAGGLAGAEGAGLEEAGVSVEAGLLSGFFSEEFELSGAELLLAA